jgi:hypothetical protein
LNTFVSGIKFGFVDGAKLQALALGHSSLETNAAELAEA